jgi:SAM-dependent methyltransferase
MDDMFDLVTAIESHYFWPDLVNDMKEVLRVLKPDGMLLMMGGEYKGGKYDKRNLQGVELANMAYHSADEFGSSAPLALRKFKCLRTMTEAGCAV